MAHPAGPPDPAMRAQVPGGEVRTETVPPDRRSTTSGPPPTALKTPAGPGEGQSGQMCVVAAAKRHGHGSGMGVGSPLAPRGPSITLARGGTPGDDSGCYTRRPPSFLSSSGGPRFLPYRTPDGAGP